MKRLLIIIFLLLSINLYGYEKTILDSVPNTRALGMGGAYTAIAEDVSALYFNPSGLAGILFPHSYNSFQLDNHFFSGIGIRKNNAGIGFAFNHWGNMYSSQSLFMAGVGKFYRNNLDLGIAIKLLKNDFYNYRSYGFGFNLGLKIYPVTDNFFMGIVFKNIVEIYDKVDYNHYYIVKIDDNIDYNHYYPSLHYGIAYTINNLALSCDINKYFFIEKPVLINGGVEYKILKIFLLRSGYRNGATFGFGIDLKETEFNCGIDLNKDDKAIMQFDLKFTF